VAIKRLEQKDPDTTFITRNFARELRVSARISHPNVSAFLGYVSRVGQQHYIVMEYTERGALRVDKDKLTMNMTASQLLAMTLGIAKGVCYLHANKIVHADIKSDNVLVSRSGEPMLTDFGLSRMEESFWSKGFYTTDATRNNPRWLPYEFYHVPDSGKFRPTPKTDV